MNRRLAEIARREWRFYSSSVIIVVSWLAAIWFLPDLRLLSVTGLGIGLWVMWQTYSRSGARVSRAPVDLPCIAFQRSLLQREHDLARSMPTRIIVPLAAGQVAIAATLATNARFTTSQFFPEGLTLFVGTAGVALAVIWRRWQGQALELKRELEALDAAGFVEGLIFSHVSRRGHQPPAGTRLHGRPQAAARALLQDRSLSIADVAFFLQDSEPAAFHRSFRCSALTGARVVCRYEKPTPLAR